MTAQSIYNALAKRARLAGIRDVSPHDGRRTFISNLLDASADIATVQQLAGHASIQTTARYDRRGEVAKSRTVALVSLPGAVA
jgi:integrase